MTFKLPAGASFEEDSNDLVVTDSNGNIVLRYDEASAEWQFQSETVTGVGSIETDELLGDWDSLVRTSDDLVSILSNVSNGETVQLTAGTHTINSWADIDGVSDVKVRGVGRYQTTVKVADGANVGGFRLGSSALTENCTVERVGVDGNKDNQTSGQNHHAFQMQKNCDDCTVRHVFAKDLHPYHKHNTGGSGVQVDNGATRYTVKDVRVDNTGDRGVQAYADYGSIKQVRTTNGFDRSVTVAGCKNVDISGVYGDGNAEGSIVGFSSSGSPAKHVTVSNVQGSGTHRRIIQIKPDAQYVTVTNFEGLQEGSDTGAPAIEVAPSASDINISDGEVTGYEGGGISCFGDNNCHFEDIQINDTAGDGIKSDGGGNHRYSDITVDGFATDGSGIGLRVVDSNNILEGLKVYNNANGVVHFEPSGADNNHYRDCWTDGNWSINGPACTYNGLYPRFDARFNLSPSGGSLTDSFAKPYAKKPLLDVTLEGEAIWHVSNWSTDGNGNYDGATLAFTDNAGNAVNPTVSSLNLKPRGR